MLPEIVPAISFKMIIIELDVIESPAANFFSVTACIIRIMPLFAQKVKPLRHKSTLFLKFDSPFLTDFHFCKIRDSIVGVIRYKKDTNGVTMLSKDLPKCPVETTLMMLNTRWKFLIIKDLLTGTKRFGELKNSLGKITQKVLTSNLREMEDSGLVERKVWAQIPPRVDYTLTDIGYSLAVVLDSMAEWGSAYKQLLKIIEKRNK